MSDIDDFNTEIELALNTILSKYAGKIKYYNYVENADRVTYTIISKNEPNTVYAIRKYDINKAVDKLTRDEIIEAIKTKIKELWELYPLSFSDVLDRERERIGAEDRLYDFDMKFTNEDILRIIVDKIPTLGFLDEDF